MTKATHEIITYSAQELELVNKATGQRWSYFGLPRVTYNQVVALLARNKRGEAFKRLKPYSNRGIVDVK